MSASAADTVDYVFGPFRLASDGRVLLCHDASVTLGARALEVLLQVVHAAPRVVGKDELLRAVWPGRVVEENNLTVQISALRRALARAGGDGFLQTVPGRGYRFVAPVERQATAAAAAAAAPGEPAEAKPALLMQPATAFIGRTADLAALRALVMQHRLTTISGIGGIGKTRVALQMVDLLEQAPPDAMWDDGIWRIELASITEPSAVAEAVAASLGLGGGREPPQQRLVAFLRQRRLLLLLDNCEHMVRPVADLVAAVLVSCPGVTVLATSRESLGVEGERIYRLPPLSLPAADITMTAATALAHDSVRLLVERAAAAAPGFSLTDANAAAIAAICTRLDGIALALEMVAPRLRVLSPAQLADRLHERFRLLVGPRGAISRQRTLRAVFDWSWELLPPAEQRLLRRMSVFAGSAGLDALCAVVAEPDQDEWALLDLIGSLVDKSLVIADTDGAAPRYRLLETTRQYAAERQEAAPEPDLQRRHSVHFARLFEAAEVAWPTAQTGQWLEAHAPDADNLRAALEWALGAGHDDALGLRLAAVSYPLWWELPGLPLREGGRWIDLAITRITAQTPPDIAARLWFGQSWRDMRFSDRENYPAAARAVALFRTAGETLRLGAALWRAGSTLLTREMLTEARELIGESVSLLRTVRPSKFLALALIRQADIFMREDRDPEALAAFEEALHLSRGLGQWYGLLNGGSNMGELLFQMNQPVRALAHLEALREELQPGRRAPLMSTLAAHLAAANLRDDALSALGEVILYAPAVGMASALAWTCETLAMLRAEAGDAALACRLAGFALLHHPSVSTRSGAQREAHLRLEAALAGFDAAERRALAAIGASWSLSEAAEHAAMALDLAKFSNDDGAV